MLVPQAGIEPATLRLLVPIARVELAPPQITRGILRAAVTPYQQVGSSNLLSLLGYMVRSAFTIIYCNIGFSICAVVRNTNATD